jgi:drug/metabolite transporter (DMT)-like permease
MKLESRLLPPAFYPLMAALLFGATTPIAKIVLGETRPQLVAGLFYLGSGIGLSFLAWIKGRFFKHEQEAKLKSQELWWLGCAILSGGVIAPVLLMIGLSSESASASSLLLNLEGVFTALIAWIVFREHTDRRMILGMAAILAGGIVLSIMPAHGFHGGGSGFWAIVSACLFWALDNNFMRHVSQANPMRLAALKGLCAGAVNTGIALTLGTALPPLPILLLGATAGFIGYGISLVLFIIGLKRLGTARAGAYFCTAPFAGAVFSLLFLHEHASVRLGVAGCLMAIGVYLHLTERHEHQHTHYPTEHEHVHTHEDEHHDHGHEPGCVTSEPHSHMHRHDQLTHMHAHMPDFEHRHDHEAPDR